MPEVIAAYDPGSDITIIALAAMVGGRGLGLPSAKSTGGYAGISDTGDGLLQCGAPVAGGAIFGVTSHDVAVNGRVNAIRPPKVVPMECSAAIALSAELMVAADGRVLTRTAGNTVIGRALSVTTAAGQFVLVELFLNGALTLT